MSGDDEYSETTKLPRMAIKKPKKKVVHKVEREVI